MALYVYCPRPSNGALELVTALEATRLRKFDGMDFWRTRAGHKRERIHLTPGDTVVCWGTAIPEMDGIHVLNAGNRITKEEELQLLNSMVPSVTYVPKQSYMSYKKAKYDIIGRSNHHIGGNDLLGCIPNPDYYTVKANFINEYRLHGFDGRSIRAGKKEVREGFQLVSADDWRPNAGLAHPWIRSFDGGWKINYDNFQSKEIKGLRTLANQALKTLSLTFGAVDIGETVTHDLLVLEVNRAPGIEGGSIQSYVRAINRWVQEQSEGKKSKVVTPPQAPPNQAPPTRVTPRPFRA